MTYEDQLGSIVSRMNQLSLSLKYIETFHEALNAQVTELSFRIEQVEADFARLQADIITFRAQTSQPGGEWKGEGP